MRLTALLRIRVLLLCACVWGQQFGVRQVQWNLGCALDVFTFSGDSCFPGASAPRRIPSSFYTDLPSDKLWAKCAAASHHAGLHAVQVVEGGVHLPKLFQPVNGGWVYSQKCTYAFKQMLSDC